MADDHGAEPSRCRWYSVAAHVPDVPGRLGEDHLVGHIAEAAARQHAGLAVRAARVSASLCSCAGIASSVYSVIGEAPRYAGALRPTTVGCGRLPLIRRRASVPEVKCWASSPRIGR